jgi:hypothetical protein
MENGTRVRVVSLGPWRNVSRLGEGRVLRTLTFAEGGYTLVYLVVELDSGGTFWFKPGEVEECR